MSDGLGGDVRWADVRWAGRRSDGLGGDVRWAGRYQMGWEEMSDGLVDVRWAGRRYQMGW